jgi:hypothetical protein
METSSHIDALLEDLAAAGGLGDEAVAEAAARLIPALRGSAALRLLDVLGEAALEVSAQLPSGHVEVRLAGQEPSLVYVEDEPGAASIPATDEEGTSARITLRLPDALKRSVEVAASREAVSVNTWIVRALSRSASAPIRRVGRHLTGYAES